MLGTEETQNERDPTPLVFLHLRILKQLLARFADLRILKELRKGLVNNMILKGLETCGCKNIETELRGRLFLTQRALSAHGNLEGGFGRRVGALSIKCKITISKLYLSCTIIKGLVAGS